jgi:hypothetical protein
MTQPLVDVVRKCSVCGQLARAVKGSCSCGNDIFHKFYQCRGCKKLFKQPACPDCSAPQQPALDQASSIAADTWTFTVGLCRYSWAKSKFSSLEPAAVEAQAALGEAMMTHALGNPQVRAQIAMLDQRLRGQQDGEAVKKTLAGERQQLVAELALAAMASERPLTAEVKDAHLRAVTARDSLSRHRQTLADHRQIFEDSWKTRRRNAAIGYIIVGFALFLVVVVLILLMRR